MFFSILTGFIYFSIYFIFENLCKTENNNIFCFITTFISIYYIILFILLIIIISEFYNISLLITYIFALTLLFIQGILLIFKQNKLCLFSSITILFLGTSFCLIIIKQNFEKYDSNNIFLLHI